ncbi:MAG: hypothetical protein HY079_14775 [Elusimicrobia bacterium]|nr:hypothetical protein [Elusimicrobiota bacterium]
MTLALLLAGLAAAQTLPPRPSEIALTAEAAAALARDRSPALRAARERARAEAADARAGGAVESPRFTGAYKAGRGDGRTELGLTFDVWSLALAGPRRTEARSAEAEAGAAAAEAALALDSAVRAAVYEVQAASATLALRRAGPSAADAIRAEADLAVARVRLARLMRVPTDAGWWTEAALPELPAADPGLAALKALAKARRPARRPAAPVPGTRELGAARLGAAAERTPEGDRLFGPSVEMELPLLGGARARSEALDARAAEAAARADDDEAAAEAEVEELAARLSAARRTAALYRGAADAGSRLALVAAQKDYWTTRARLERAVGGPF